MEISYIILAHKNPKQLKRLILNLSSPYSKFYVHIDKNANIHPFQKEVKDIKEVILLQENERKPGVWGDITIVEGTLNAMTKVINDGRTGHCILLSGQDYPLKPVDEIYKFFTKNKDTHFIDIFRMPGKWGAPGMARINKYKINKSNKRGHFTFLSSIFEKDFYKWETAGKLNYLRKSGKFREIWNFFHRREFPKYIKPFGGSVYWSFPVGTVHKILNFINEHPDYLDYHKYTLCADEIFFHSILMYLQEKEQLIIKPSLTYTNWTRPLGPLPVTFSKNDIEEIKAASIRKLFARKFDITMDNEILNLIDKELLCKA